VCVGIFSFYMHVGIFCNMHVGIFCSMHVGIFCNMHVRISVACILDLTRVGKLLSLDCMFGILVRAVIILDSACVHVPGFRVESCDVIIMCVHVEFQLVNLPHCTS
jgi:hypothetical protein